MKSKYLIRQVSYCFSVSLYGTCYDGCGLSKEARWLVTTEEEQDNVVFAVHLANNTKRFSFKSGRAASRIYSKNSQLYISFISKVPEY